MSTGRAATGWITGAALGLLALGLVAPHALAIGPDAFGYTAAATTYSWNEISSTGTSILPNTDNGFQNVALGFGFQFYGTTYNNVYISTNGLLTFGAGDSSPANVDLSTTAPSVDAPAIAVLWDDWKTLGAPQVVYYQTVLLPQPYFVIEWNAVPNVPANQDQNPATFEVVLHGDTGYIDCYYQDTVVGSPTYNQGGSATVGIRDINGNVTLRNVVWEYNGSLTVGNNSAVEFAPPQAAPEGVPEPGTLALLAMGLGSMVAWRRRRRV